MKTKNPKKQKKSGKNINLKIINIVQKRLNTQLKKKKKKKKQTIQKKMWITFEKTITDS